MNTFEIIKKTFFINFKEFNNLFFLFILAGFISIFFELVGLSFFAILVEKIINQDSVMKLPFFNYSINMQYIEYKNLIIISFSFFFLRFLSIIFLGLYQKKYIYKLRDQLSVVAINSYFKSNYLQSKKLDSSEMIRNTAQEVDSFSLALTNSLMTFILDIIMILFISFLLFSINAKVTLSILLFFNILIFIYVIIFKNKILELGKNRYTFEANRISFIQRIFYSYREINLQNVSEKFISDFKSLNKNNSKDLILNEMINFIFRPILEFLIIFIVLFSLFFLGSYLANIENFSILLILAVVSLARVLPSMTRIIHSINNFKFFKPTVDSVSNYYSTQIENKINNSKINFIDKFSFENINFNYSDSKNVLNNFSIDIFFKKKTAIIGPSGSGKTTIANIFSGFIEPISGKIKIDDKYFDSLNDISWKKNIGYLSQDYYLINNNIYHNVCFPKKYLETDKEKIDKIINLLELNSIFPNEDKSKFNIGENGNLLSGGQRQRVAIARIIYQNPKIIILDEFTTGLDNKIEIEITNLIFDLFKEKTILIITHNKDIIKIVDEVIDISKDAK